MQRVGVARFVGIFRRGGTYLGVATGAMGTVKEALRPMIGFAYSLHGLLLPAQSVLVELSLFKLFAEIS